MNVLAIFLYWNGAEALPIIESTPTPTPKTKTPTPTFTLTLRPYTPPPPTPPPHPHPHPHNTNVKAITGAINCLVCVTWDWQFNKHKQ